MEKFKLYIRADGNAQMGLGHVIRSLALAEMLSADFDCHFLIRMPIRLLIPQIKAVCEELIVLPEPENDLAEADFLNHSVLPPESLVVLDGYHFTTEYQRLLKKARHTLVCIDDIHASPFLADAVINHAGGAQPTDYETADYTKLYLGLSYLLARSPFRAAARKRVPLEMREEAVFICFGGADPNNETLTTLQKCEALPTLKKCYVILGSAYLHQEALDQFIAQSKLEIVKLNNLSAEEMVIYMQKCRAAITSPSTVAYEYLSVGGILYLKVIADNQKEVYQHALSTGLAFALEDYPQHDQELLQRALHLQKQLLDGEQDKRLRQVFFDLLLQLRPATEEDCELYFEWANELETRKQSFNSDAIPFSVHEQWFKEKLQDKHYQLYLCEVAGQPAGQVRLVDSEEGVLINYSVDKAFRGKRLGSLFLNRALHRFVENKATPEVTFIGYVKHNNMASNRTFEK